MSKKCIIAMSGGVDSSVAAFLMKENGYECIGATMKLYDNEDIGINREKTCCSLDDIEDARAVARRLSMPYYVFNFKDEFEEKVINKFIKTYENGGTPNPCIDCNRYLKFEKLFQRMYELGFDYVVTGHYAIVEEKDGWFYLKKGKDDTKDQSYVLYSLTQSQLSHIKFPLGKYSKVEIRKIAEEQRFLNARKRDRQDICFVPDGDYDKFIEAKHIRTVILLILTVMLSAGTTELSDIQTGREKGLELLLVSLCMLQIKILKKILLLCVQTMSFFQVKLMLLILTPLFLIFRVNLNARRV